MHVRVVVATGKEDKEEEVVVGRGGGGGGGGSGMHQEASHGSAWHHLPNEGMKISAHTWSVQSIAVRVSKP
jgi:hypothetical protein